MKKIIFLILSAFAVSMAAAEETAFKILPWNGHASAVSLTFDDGDPIHLDFAIPEMKKRGMRGTFYLISDKLERPEEWNKAAREGMEIGNHSATHRHAAELDEDEVIKEVDGAGKSLKEATGQETTTFAYPFVEITEALRERVEKNCIAARGGGPDVYYGVDSEPDWYNIHSSAAMTEYPYEKYDEWIKNAEQYKGWTVLMIHAIEGSDWWQPMPKEIFKKLLERLGNGSANRRIWTAPFGEVAAYWKAQKILEKAQPGAENGVTYIRWEKPALFPAGVILKVMPSNTKALIMQDGVKLKKQIYGGYDVSFDCGGMAVLIEK